VPTDEGATTSPVSAYGLSKLTAERLALLMGRRLDVPTVALRYAVVYGPGQSLSNPYSTVITAFATRLCRGEAPTLYEDGEQQRDWIFVDDVVRASLLAAGDERAAFEVFNVGSGTGHSVRELAEHLGRRLAQDIAVEPSLRYRVGDYRHLVLDITKLRALGFEPAVSLAEGLAHFVRGIDSAGMAGVLGRI
jgi:dTDP-L-rhamnose 4-epimerase